MNTRDLRERYYVELAAAYVRGKLGIDLDGAGDEDESELFRRGEAAGLGLHRFKRTQGLPRVARVLGALRGLGPETLVDVGSGRGVFLWPLLDAFPEMRVTALDVLPRRVEDIQAVRRGGVRRLFAARMDVTRLGLAARSADVVTVLEVLEHLEDPARAAAEACRVARRFVVASVPSREDDNPEHIHLFTPRDLARLFERAGARRVTVDHVLNHAVLVARVGSA